MQKGRKKGEREKKRKSKVKVVGDLGHAEKRKRKRKDVKSQNVKEDTVVFEAKSIQKRIQDESEQLERSNLTEEHQHPVCLQNSYLSDSTGNNNKKRNQTSPMNDIRRTHGNVLRIRLPSPKVKEPDASVNEEKLCSSSKLIQEELCSGQIVCQLDKEQFCSTSGQTGKCNFGNGMSTSKNKIQTIESLFKDLVENWVSPPVQSEQTDADELEWLFVRKVQNREKANAASSCGLCTGSADLCPRAQFLPEADIYVLPFTVPF